MRKDIFYNVGHGLRHLEVGMDDHRILDFTSVQHSFPSFLVSAA